MELLTVQDLSVRIETFRQTTHVLSEVGVAVESGRTLGVVGETGCGKSLVTLAILGLLPGAAKVSGGEVRYLGRDLLRCSAHELQRLRGAQISFIPPNPRSSLDPVRRIGETLAAVIRAHRPLSRTDAHGEAERMLQQVGIPDPAERLNAYPFELSGGMAQRIAIAMALINSPKVLIADEPTSGLDVTVQAQILELLAKLSRDFQTGTLMVTRDLAIVAHYCDSVAVMYAGWIVEQSDVRQFFAAPLHPYSTAILAAVSPKEHKRSYFSMAGNAPRLTQPARACVCVDRCQLVEPICRTAMPPLVQVEPGRFVRCHVVARQAEDASR